jgi:DNA-binding Lrp family transcriptional regulator
MLRLSRRRLAADAEAIGERVGASEEAVRDALRRLDREGFVERRGPLPPRLTLVGFGVALASLPARPKAALPSRNRRTSRAA